MYNFINGSSGPNKITGTDLDDYVQAKAGDDTVNAGKGNDVVYGEEGNDTLDGGAGNDRLNGGTDNDTVFGGAGNDILSDWVLPSGPAGNDHYDGGDGIDTITFTRLDGQANHLVLDLRITTAQDTIFAGTDSFANIENVIFSLGDVTIYGTGTANQFITGPGKSTLFGYEGDDMFVVALGYRSGARISGGTGSDTFVFNLGTAVSYYDAIEPIDGPGYALSLAMDGQNQRTSGGIVVLDSVENLVGTIANDTLTGNEGTNLLAGNYGNDLLIGGAGDDRLFGDGRYRDTSEEGFGALEFLNSVPRVAAGNDVLEGGTGNDTLHGGFGSDTASYAHATGSVQVDLLAAAASGADGEDTLLSIENATGSAFDDTLTGDASANRLDGGAGIDTLSGGAGDDTYVVSSAQDTVIELANGGRDTIESGLSYDLDGTVERLVLTGSAAINGTGTDAANDLVGNAAANVLTGRGGDDTYWVQNSDDTVIEAAGGGHDLVESSVSFALSAHVEDLVLAKGRARLNGTGNDLNNTITGNAGNNIIDGKGGADIMRGGAGDDSYMVDNSGDRVVEAYTFGTGIDTVQVSLKRYVTPQGIEKLVMLDGAVEVINETLYTTMTIIGNAADNRIDGGTGVSRMFGGGGNDTYIVHNQFDGVTEKANAGIDTIIVKAIDFTMTANIENAVLIGENCDVTGNRLANTITGSDFRDVVRAGAGNDRIAGGGGGDFLVGEAGNDVIDGGAGDDGMVGGSGNDTFYVDAAFDQVSEDYLGGTDTVFASADWFMSDNIEILRMTGSAIRAYGTGQANQIYGNDLDNVIDGGFGNDIVRGGKGNDTYYVHQQTQSVIEVQGEGTDTVYSDSSFTLGANVETLILRSSTSQQRIARGNALANQLTGSGASDILDGGAGADALDGGAGDDLLVAGRGHDSLSGGEGADRFALNPNETGQAAAAITDFIHGTDVIELIIAGPSGALGPDAFALGTAAADAGTRAIFDEASGNLWYDADGTGTAAKILVATLSAGAELAASDIAFLALADLQARYDAVFI